MHASTCLQFQSFLNEVTDSNDRADIYYFQAQVCIRRLTSLSVIFLFSMGQVRVNDSVAFSGDTVAD